MKKRTLLRPVIPTIAEELPSSLEEQFQNETVRPVVKLLHELLIALFLAYAKTKKIDLGKMSEFDKRAFILSAFQRDMAFRNRIKGMVIGQFDFEEFNSYLSIQKDIDKRIINMTLERVLNTLTK